jgi:hypothetical protein
MQHRNRAMVVSSAFNLPASPLADLIVTCQASSCGHERQESNVHTQSRNSPENNAPYIQVKMRRRGGGPRHMAANNL